MVQFHLCSNTPIFNKSWILGRSELVNFEHRVNMTNNPHNFSLFTAAIWRNNDVYYHYCYCNTIL